MAKYVIEIEQNVTYKTMVIVDAKNFRQAVKRAYKTTPNLPETAWEVDELDYDVSDVYEVKPEAKIVRLVKPGK